MGCYICDREKESVEHAPAKCFFPKGKRENLITVDSCSKHNEDTSKDDEYVRNIIAMAVSNNDVAYQHFLKKCVRSFENSQALLKETTGEKRRVFIEDVENNKGLLKPTYAFKIKRKRIDKVIKKIGYAIFYYNYGERWNRELFTGTEHLRNEGMEAEELGKLIQDSKKELVDLEFKGYNPKVFKYAFLHKEKENIHDSIMIARFYEGFEFWLFSKNNTTGPKI